MGFWRGRTGQGGHGMRGGRTAWCHSLGGGSGVAPCPLGCSPSQACLACWWLLISSWLPFSIQALTPPGQDALGSCPWHQQAHEDKTFCLSLLACPTTAQGWTRGPHVSHHTSSLSRTIEASRGGHSLLPSFLHSPSLCIHSLSPIASI